MLHRADSHDLTLHSPFHHQTCARVRTQRGLTRPHTQKSEVLKVMNCKENRSFLKKIGFDILLSVFHGIKQMCSTRERAIPNIRRAKKNI